MDVQVDLSLGWLHRSYCRFCCALAPLFLPPVWKRSIFGAKEDFISEGNAQKSKQELSGKSCLLSKKKMTENLPWISCPLKSCVGLRGQHLSGLQLNPWPAEPDITAFANSVDPDQLASAEANWSGSAVLSLSMRIFVIKYENFCQKPGSTYLTGWKLEVGVASKYTCIQHGKS